VSRGANIDTGSEDSGVFRDNFRRGTCDLVDPEGKRRSGVALFGSRVFRKKNFPAKRSITDEPNWFRLRAGGGLRERNRRGRQAERGDEKKDADREFHGKTKMR
jgi:hypothetical protein